MTSLEAVRRNDLGRAKAAKTKAARNPATTASHTLERLLKAVLWRNFRRDQEVTLVTVVTCACSGANR